jgi:transcription elongation factor GreA
MPLSRTTGWWQFFLNHSLTREVNMSQGNFVYLTKERLVEIEKELKEMKTNGRKEMADKIATARAHGDLSENAEYDAAKEEQGLFELKIRQIEDVLSRARIIDKSQLTKGQVGILSQVKIKNLKSQKSFEYLLVSPEEADFQEGKISVTSPVGKGLIGAKVGDKVKVKAPAGILEFEILSIE